jgi:hypothetical protein
MKVNLQALARVENNTDEDWHQVQLNLVPCELELLEANQSKPTGQAKPRA